MIPENKKTIISYIRLLSKLSPLISLHNPFFVQKTWVSGVAVKPRDTAKSSHRIFPLAVNLQETVTRRCPRVPTARLFISLTAGAGTRWYDRWKREKWAVRPKVWLVHAAVNLSKTYTISRLQKTKRRMDSWKMHSLLRDRCNARNFICWFHEAVYS